MANARTGWRAIVVVLATALASSAATAQTPQSVEIVTQAGTMHAELYVPEAGGPAPGVIVLHTAYGRVELADRNFAKALAGNGFVALVPDYTVVGKGRDWSPTITRALSAAVDWLRRRPEVDGRPIGAVGFSLGAHALTLAAQNASVKAVVVYYGAYDVRELKGARLPAQVRLPMDVAGSVDAAVLLLHGDNDDEVPVSHARKMEDALKQAGKTVDLVVYDGAYHRFDRGRTADMDSDRNKEGHVYIRDAAAAEAARERSLAWLETNLISTPAARPTPPAAASGGTAFFSEDDVRSTLVGNTMAYTAPNGMPIAVFFAADGSVSMRLGPAGSGRVVPKRWWMAPEGVICRTIGRENSEHCTRVSAAEVDGMLQFHTAAGKPIYQAELSSGNAVSP